MVLLFGSMFLNYSGGQTCYQLSVCWQSWSVKIFFKLLWMDCRGVRVFCCVYLGSFSCLLYFFASCESYCRMNLYLFNALSEVCLYFWPWYMFVWMLAHPPPPRKDVTYLTVIAAGLYSGPRLLACFVLDFVCVCAGKYPRPLGGDVIVHTEIK